MQGSTSQQLLQMLEDQAYISRDQRLIIETDTKEKNLSVDVLLVEYGFISADAVNDCIVQLTGSRVVSLEQLIVDPQALDALDAAIAKRYQAFPVFYHNERSLLEVAVADPSDVIVRDVIDGQLAGRCTVEYCQASAPEIERAIESAYGFEQTLDAVIAELSGKQEANLSKQSRQNNQTNLLANGLEHPIVRLTNGLIMQAYREIASDIHFEPEAAFFRVRFRVDGLLRSCYSLHIQHWPACATRLKVMAGLNIAETRDCQDGAFSLRIGGAVVDLRLSVFPTVHGENIVVRVLDRSNAGKNLDDTGLDSTTCQVIRRAASEPQGLVLLVGPTGCGKTTTLYGLLNYLSDESVNIMTLEDPVEYQLPLVRQSSVSATGKLNFANGIRSVLRQDPDIILVGEIRDAETADLSMRAAMTGHMVLSTLHARSVMGAFRRLNDLGIDKSVLIDSVSAIVSQRLLRVLCERCKTLANGYSHTHMEGAAVEFEPKGCPNCLDTGFKGRLAIAEVLSVDDQVRACLHSDGWLETVALEKAAANAGFKSISQTGAAALQQGLTSRDELQRVLGNQEIENPEYSN